jgi:3-dehydroquinate synthase
MAELCVGLSERSYPIFIETGGLERIGSDLANRQVGKRYGIVSDDRVANLYGQRVLRALQDAGIHAQLFIFPHGEAHKTLATVGDLASQLARAGFDRKDALIALGGGVTGDITGFLASSYMRGIPFVQVPTTLLAQVDSSVGGKTGVDIPEGKNLVGAFYQPKAVYIDPSVLKSLDYQELLSGIAEVIKYGVIRDASFFEFLEKNRKQVLSLTPAILEGMISACCTIKADVVEQDEREGGLRRILNYGHTIGHAVEAASAFTMRHGFAVAIGMVAAAKLSAKKQLLSPADVQRISSLIASYGLPVAIPENLDREVIKAYLKTDKKVMAGKVFYILPKAIGSTIITDDISNIQLDEVLLPD